MPFCFLFWIVYQVLHYRAYTTQDTKKQRFTVTTCSYIGQKKLRNTRKTAKINNQKEFVNQNFSRFFAI